MTQDITVIVGPTAVGKSQFAIELAQKEGAEIISSDAFQVYQYMDIGTAKVLPAEQGGVAHHLIDIKTPDQGYNVAEFLEKTDILIRDIRARNKPIIICGGTAYYSYAFVNQFNFGASAASDPQLKADLQRDLDQHGPAYLFERYKAIDPVGADAIDAQNGIRLIRALEIYALTQRPPSELKPTPIPRNDVKIIGLHMERDAIINRIEVRVDQMFKRGLVEEVDHIISLGYVATCPAFKAIGYKEVCQLLDNTLSLNDCVARVKAATRQFSKRQMTWFKKFEHIKWITISK